MQGKERRLDITRPPPGAWIESVKASGRVYHYLKWREGGRRLSLRLSEEEYVKAREVIERRKSMGLVAAADPSKVLEGVREVAKRDEGVKKLLGELGAENFLKALELVKRAYALEGEG